MKGKMTGDQIRMMMTTPPPQQHQKKIQTIPLVINKPDVEDDNCPDLIKRVKEINDQLSRPDETTDVGGSGVTEIVGHQWQYGQLSLKILWSGADTTWEILKD
eukprot:8751253-Ditylum_brightwellii.AAC.1